MKRLNKTIFIINILICLCTSIYAQTKKINLNDTYPVIYSPSAILIDYESGRVLFEKDGYSKKNIASLTKMMTAIVVMENVDLDEVVEIRTSSAVIGGSTIGMKKGDKISVNALMHGMLMESGNDCAYALGEYVGGNIENFAKMMTEKAISIGAKDSSFKNPHGLDVEGHYSTAYDMSIITRYALNNKYINNIVGTNSIDVQFGNSAKTFNNTNKLLRTYEFADGVKTGFTNGANRCLIGSATKGDMRVIAVILGATTTDIRFKDAKVLLEYGLENYSMKNLLSNMNWYINIPVYKGSIDYYEKYMTGEIMVAMTDKEYSDIYIKQELVPVITAPAQKGYNLGTVSICVGNEVVYSKKVILDINIDKKTVFDYMKEGIKNRFKLEVDLI